ncbi:MAG: tetratricopeptide repeat protein [Candidatus Accumulibacter sp.]|uniref:Tetratricopeptide repeat protein n=1 Tax=Candidatus Accumulibacter affinis TaxID=2954384 RepID=A0A935T7C7_9PROT|nr:tetratricopeptide repeat protein [Candidatus Accumulibacter affinis]
MLATRRRVLGDEHPDTLGGMRNLIATLWDANQQEEARDMAKSLYGLYRKVNGPQHETTVTTGLRLLQMYGELGDQDAANLLIAELASEKQARP